MADHSTVAVFNSVEQARAAMDELDRNGISRDHVTVVANELESKQELHGLVSGTDQNVTVGLGGGITGAISGLVLGVLLMGGATLLPLGEQFTLPVLAGGVVGCIIAGTIFGALIGSMLGRGIKQARIQPYDEQVRGGKSLVVSHGTHDEMTRAQRILKAAGAIDTKVHHHVTAPADSTEAV